MLRTDRTDGQTGLTEGILKDQSVGPKSEQNKKVNLTNGRGEELLRPCWKTQDEYEKNIHSKSRKPIQDSLWKNNQTLVQIHHFGEKKHLTF